MDATIEKIDIQASYNGSDAVSGLDKLYDSLNKISKMTDKVTTATERSSAANVTSKVNFSKIQRVATITAKALSKCFDATNDYVESLNLFNVAMGTGAGQAEIYAKTVERLMGIDSGDWMNYQGSFNQIFEGYGIAEEKANSMSKQLTQLAYDLSSLWNVDVDTAFQKIQSGMSGQIKGLKVWGYNLSVASLRETALAHGIDLSTAKMTEAQKATLRYVTLMEAASNAQGDLSRTLVTPANSVRILGAQFEILKRTVGKVVSVFAVKLIPVVQVMIQWLTALAEKMAAAFGYEMPEIDYSGIGAGADYADDLTDSLDESTKSAEKLKKTILGIDEINKLTDNSKDSSATAYGGGYAPDFGWDLSQYDYDFLGKLDTSKVDELKEKLDKILSLVVAIGAGLATWKLTHSVGLTLAVGGFVLEAGGIKDAIENGLDNFNFVEIVFGGLVGTGGSALLGSKIAIWLTKAFADSKIAVALSKAAAAAGKTVGSFGGTIGAGIGAIIAGIPMYITGIYDAIKNGLDWLNGILIPLGSTMAGAGIGAIIGSLGGPIGTGIGALIGLAVGALTDLGILIYQEWDSISTWFSEKFTVIGDFFGGLWSKISTGASECWQNIKDFFSPATEWFSELFGSVSKTLSDIFYNIGVIAGGCWDVIKIVWDKASTWFDENVIQPISGFFSDLWASVSKAVEATWEAVKTTFGTLSDFFGNIFRKAWEKVVEVFSPLGEIFIDIKDGILAGFKNIVNGIISGLNKVISVPFNGINSALRFIKNIKIVGIQPFANLKEINVPQIPLLANGGFVNAGQMFIANEAGPELIGTIGNKTAVANTQQIVEGISGGVADGNAPLIALFHELIGLTRQLLEKENTVQAVVTTSDITSGIQRKNRRDGKVIIPAGG